MRFSSVWILLFATPFVSSLRLRAEPAISEERSGVEKLVELLHKLPKDVAMFKRSMSYKSRTSLKEQADAILNALWKHFRVHIGQRKLPRLDRIKNPTKKEAVERTFDEYINQDPERIKEWTKYMKLRDGKSAELVPVGRSNRVRARGKTISDDMAKRILPTLWIEFKRASAPLEESYNVPSFYHLSPELQEEIQHSFWEFIYADRKRAKKFEGLLTWLKRNDYGKRLLAQEIEAQKAEFIRQQQWNGLRQQNELSGHDDVPTSDRLEPTLKEFLEPSQKAFVREDPRRKDLSEQLAEISNPGSPDTELTLGRAS